MAQPILYPGNHLEVGTVTVTGAATGKPKERLFDRDITLPYQDSAVSPSPREITSDQGAGGTQTVDTWIVPPGHNLSGVALTIQSSPDMSAWTTRDTFTPSDATLILRALTSLLLRGWRHQAATPGSAPILHELFFTQAVTLGGVLPFPFDEGPQGNVSRWETPAGVAQRSKRGDARWGATYPLQFLTSAERTALEAAYALTGEGAKFLYLKDSAGTARWVEWLNARLRFTPVFFSGQWGWDLVEPLEFLAVL